MSPKATPRTHASKTELLRVRNIRSQRHIVPVPPQNEGARTRSSDEPSSNVSAYMSMYVHAQASATSLHRTLNLSANKYYYYYPPVRCWAKNFSRIDAQSCPILTANPNSHVNIQYARYSTFTRAPVCRTSCTLPWLSCMHNTHIPQTALW